MVSCRQRRGLRETEMLFSKLETIILSQHHHSMTWLLLCPVIRTINKKEAMECKCRFPQLIHEPTDITGSKVRLAITHRHVDLSRFQQGCLFVPIHDFSYKRDFYFSVSYHHNWRHFFVIPPIPILQHPTQNSSLR